MCHTLYSIHHAPSLAPKFATDSGRDGLPFSVATLMLKTDATVEFFFTLPSMCTRTMIHSSSGIYDVADREFGKTPQFVRGMLETRCVTFKRS